MSKSIDHDHVHPAVLLFVFLLILVSIITISTGLNGKKLSMNSRAAVPPPPNPYIHSTPTQSPSNVLWCDNGRTPPNSCCANGGTCTQLVPGAFAFCTTLNRACERSRDPCYGVICARERVASYKYCKNPTTLCTEHEYKRTGCFGDNQSCVGTKTSSESCRHVAQACQAGNACETSADCDSGYYCTAKAKSGWSAKECVRYYDQSS